MKKRDGRTNRLPHSRMGGSGVAIGAGFDIVPVFGGGHSRSMQQTQLAERLAPPVKPRDSKLAIRVLAALCSFIVGMVISTAALSLLPGGITNDAQYHAAVLIGFALAFVISRFLHPPLVQMFGMSVAQQKQYEDAFAAWERLFFCHRCGRAFEPGKPAGTARG